MEPIDFTKPEAFRGASADAGGLGEAPGLNQSKPEPSSDDALRLRRSLRWLLFWILLAPLSWALLAALLAFMDTAHPLAEAAAAHHEVMETSTLGKIVLLANQEHSN